MDRINDFLGNIPRRGNNGAVLLLDGQPVRLKVLRIGVRQQLAGKDMSGKSSATDQAEMGDKGKVLVVTGVITFDQGELLNTIFTMANTKVEGARHVWRISNKTAEALKVRQVKFQGTIRADEEVTLRQWNVMFELVEQLSVAERQEKREPEKKAAQQKVQGVKTETKDDDEKDVPADTEVPLTGVMAFLKKIDDQLADDK
ncbi:adenine glycosylase [Photobacterium phosphoreum]|uniref:baseplate complex protein n=1 Tax=Photobacterium phosphoreum TaxID=659 RepID=UPI001E43E93D|nr:adenine glycosylase [Photobacterium phosphoreum]MCD9511947.1 adenine glycosylase [Photobacterium phosphoreum]